jgi:hypothetical protein
MRPPHLRQTVPSMEKTRAGTNPAVECNVANEQAATDLTGC